MARNDDYDWLDDPFNDKKNAQDGAQQAKVGTGTKAAVGCGCVLVIAGIVVAAVLLIAGAGSLLA